MRRTSMLVGLTAALALAFTAGCSSHAPSAATGRFCQLLVGDYQKLKTLPQAKSTAEKQKITNGYVSFAPTLEAAAPADIANATTIYVSAVSQFLTALQRAGYDPVQIPPAAIARMSAPDVSTASSKLSSYSKSKCDYDLLASGTSAGQSGGG